MQESFCVSGFGFPVSGFKFPVSGSGVLDFRFRVWHSGLRVEPARVPECFAGIIPCFVFRVSDFEVRLSTFRFRDQGSGLRVSGFGSSVSGFGFQFQPVRVPRRLAEIVSCFEFQFSGVGCNF